MKGRSLISKFLLDRGVKEVFLVPGVHILPLIDSFVSCGISTYVARCERGLLFMADGYSRASGKTAVAILTPGPGLAVGLVGFMEAIYSETPLLLIHVDVNSDEKGRGVLHELREPEKMVEPVTKSRMRIEDANDLPEALEMSFFLTKEGRPGPVLLSIPYYVLDMEISEFQSKGFERGEDEGIERFLEELSRILANKKKPVIIAGWQMMTNIAQELLDEICTEGNIPLLTTTGGKGVVDERKIYAFGNLIQKGTVKRILKEADIVIAIGTRLRNVDTRRRGVVIGELVHIDSDETYFGKNYSPSLTGKGDPSLFLKGIRELLKGRRFYWDLNALKEAYKKEIGRLKENEGFRIVRAIRDSVPEETVTVWDLNILSYWAEYYFPVYKQRSFFMPRGSSSIFFGLPASIGAKIARMNEPCLSVCGDGGILASIGELATMAKYNLPVVIIVYNNSSFGVLERLMSNRYKVSGFMSLENPDFSRLAEAFGFKAERAKNEDELSTILRKRVSWDEPFIVELSLPIIPSPWEVEHR